MKFGTLKQNGMPITAIWSKSKPEIEFQYGGRLYFEPGNFSRQLRYMDEIWFADRFSLLEKCNVSYLRRRWTDVDEIWSAGRF